MGRQEDKVKRGAVAYLESGENVLAAVIARPRGSTINDVGGNLGPLIGGRKVHEAMAAGANAGVALANPMALLVTTRRVVVLKIGSVFGLGIGVRSRGLCARCRSRRSMSCGSGGRRGPSTRREHRWR